MREVSVCCCAIHYCTVLLVTAGKPRPNSACPMGTNGKGAGLSAAQRFQQQRNSLPPAAATVSDHHNAAGARRVSFPLLPSHAMLGSQMSREASKSFWSQEMLRDMERKMKEDSHKLPPIQGSHVITASYNSRKSSYDSQVQQTPADIYRTTRPSVSSYHRSKTHAPLPTTNNVPSLYGQA